MFRSALIAVLLMATPALAQQAAPARVRGTVEALTGHTLTVHARGGEEVSIALPENFSVIAIAPAAITDIKPGAYIGTAAMPKPDGTLVALEIQVFPEAMRGVGEGHRPWDLKPDSSMTNGTVGDVTVANGRTLTLKYKDGQQIVYVPPEAPIITYKPGTAAQLTAGAHVIILASKDADGSLHADRVQVGENGLVPPM
jgi:hypothetical protein